MALYWFFRITTNYHCMLLLPSLWHYTTIFLLYTTSTTSTSTAASSTTTTTFSITSYTRDASLFYTCCFQNLCESSPCKNGGTCESGYTDKGYRCVCRWGFSSSHCERGIILLTPLKSRHLFISQRYQMNWKVPCRLEKLPWNQIKPSFQSVMFIKREGGSGQSNPAKSVPVD